MKMILICAVLALSCADASGQALVNGVPPGLPTQGDVQSAVSSLLPPICGLPPMQDTVTGSAGVGDPCTHRADATSQTVIQAKTTVTASDATYVTTWDASFQGTPIYADARVIGQSQPFVCTVTATATGASGKCFQLVSTTLPTVATSLLGLVVSPVQSAAAGLSVRVVARQ